MLFKQTKEISFAFKSREHGNVAEFQAMIPKHQLGVAEPHFGQQMTKCNGSILLKIFIHFGAADIEFLRDRIGVNFFRKVFVHIENDLLDLYIGISDCNSFAIGVHDASEKQEKEHFLFLAVMRVGCKKTAQFSTPLQHIVV